MVGDHEDRGEDQCRLHARAAKDRLQMLTLCLCLCYALLYYGWHWKREWDEMKGTSLDKNYSSCLVGAVKSCDALLVPIWESRAEQDAFRGGILADGSSGLAPFRVSLFFEEMPLS